jgi:hypothetical protein
VISNRVSIRWSCSAPGECTASKEEMKTKIYHDDGLLSPNLYL